MQRNSTQMMDDESMNRKLKREGNLLKVLLIKQSLLTFYLRRIECNWLIAFIIVIAKQYGKYHFDSSIIIKNYDFRVKQWETIKLKPICIHNGSVIKLLNKENLKIQTNDWNQH